MYVLQFMWGALNSVFGRCNRLLGLGLVTVIVRHWTWLPAPRFRQLRVWTAKRPGCKQVMARSDRIGDQVRVVSQPRPRASETVVPRQRGCYRTGRESGRCCHVAVRIGERSSKGRQWDSLCRKQTKRFFFFLSVKHEFSDLTTFLHQLKLNFRLSNVIHKVILLQSKKLIASKLQSRLIILSR